MGVDAALGPERVLLEVNAQQGTNWRLIERLAGGYQSGAFLLVDSSNRRAVLKWTTSAAWAPVVLAAEPVIAAARACGWPTPAWLATGSTTSGGAYVVQEFVNAMPQDPVTHDWLDLVLPVIAGQTGLGKAGMRDWSFHDHETVYRDRDGHQALLNGTSTAAASLVSTVQAVVQPFEAVVVPSTDLVHGDFDPSNVLIRDGAVAALVDVEAVGRGSRLHDLADLALHTALWDTRDVHDRLVQKCRAIAQPGWFEVTISSIALGLMSFGVRNWSGADLDAACDETRRTLSRLFSAD